MDCAYKNWQLRDLTVLMKSLVIVRSAVSLYPQECHLVVAWEGQVTKDILNKLKS